MFSLKHIFKNYEETGSFNEKINLHSFIDAHLFVTKTGDVGAVLEVPGVDYECLDGAVVNSLTKRLESAFKLFDENYRIYQYLFKRNNQTIPFKLYGNAVVDAAISGRIAYFTRKAETLFSLSIYFVVLYEGFRPLRSLGSILLGFRENPLKTLGELWAYFSPRKQITILDSELGKAQAALRQRIDSFVLQVSDFLAVRLLDKYE